MNRATVGRQHQQAGPGLLYSLLLLLLLPFMVLRLLLKSLALPGYRQRIGERFAGFTPPRDWPCGQAVVWIHAVSVGEVVAAAPLVQALQARAIKLVLTTTTPTGSERARQLFGNALLHLYAPYDLGFVVARFVGKLQPALLVIMETELWPNLLYHCRRRGVKVLLANARLSPQSAAGYRRIAALTRGMLTNINHIAAQSPADAQRFIGLGAGADKVSVTGSLKFHVDVSQRPGEGIALFKAVQASHRPVLIAASTRPGEEARVLAAFQQVKAESCRPLLLLVPRHPQRFDKVARLCVAQGLKLQRRSVDAALDSSTEVLLGDSMGELLSYYRLADIAFVGGSLVDTGGQNVLEPAALGLPVVVGPSQFNFATVCQQLAAAGALLTVPDSAGLAAVWRQLLHDPATVQAMGHAGSTLVRENRQALPKLLTLIETGLLR